MVFLSYTSPHIKHWHWDYIRLKYNNLIKKKSNPLKRKLKQWWLTIPPISTKRIFISQLKSLNIKKYHNIQIHFCTLTLEFRVLACDKHENVAVFNRWMGLLKKPQDLFEDKPNNTDMDSHTEYLIQVWRFPHI